MTKINFQQDNSILRDIISSVEEYDLEFESEQTTRIPFISCYGLKCEYHNSFDETN